MQVQKVQNNNNYKNYNTKQEQIPNFCARTIMGGTNEYKENSAVKQKPNSFFNTIKKIFKKIINFFK